MTIISKQHIIQYKNIMRNYIVKHTAIHKIRVTIPSLLYSEI